MADLDKKIEELTISHTEHSYRIGHLEEKIKVVELDIVRTREAILLRLEDLKKQVDTLHIDRLLERDREQRSKNMQRFIDVMVNIGANITVILVAAKAFGFIK